MQNEIVVNPGDRYKVYSDHSFLNLVIEKQNDTTFISFLFKTDLLKDNDSFGSSFGALIASEIIMRLEKLIWQFKQLN